MGARALVSWLISCLGLFGLYLLFASQLIKSEVVGGIGAAIAATVAAGVLGTVGTVKFRPRVGDVLEAWRIPYYAVQGTFELFKALGLQLFTSRGADSLVQAVSYEVGGEDPTDCAPRTLALLYTSMTPNFVVLGVVHKQRLLLYHQVVRGDVLQMTINLGARP